MKKQILMVSTCAWGGITTSVKYAKKNMKNKLLAVQNLPFSPHPPMRVTKHSMMIKSRFPSFQILLNPHKLYMFQNEIARQLCILAFNSLCAFVSNWKKKGGKNDNWSDTHTHTHRVKREWERGRGEMTGYFVVMVTGGRSRSWFLSVMLLETAASVGGEITPGAAADFTWAFSCYLDRCDCRLTVWHLWGECFYSLELYFL